MPSVRARVIECLQDADPLVQGCAILACKYLVPPPTTEVLDFLRSPDARLREAAYATLEASPHAKDPRVFTEILRVMEDPDLTIASRARGAVFSMDQSVEQARLVREADRRFEVRVEAAKRPVP